VERVRTGDVSGTDEHTGSPTPPADASEDEQIAWGEKVEEEMNRLERRLNRRDPNPDGNTDRKDAHA
jgi:hypothetical protein